MIGLLIGLFTVLAVTQTYLAWGEQHRTIVAKNDAQTTVTLAAYAIDQDLRQAAQGFGSAMTSDPMDFADAVAGCPVSGTALAGGATTPIQFLMQGLQIIDGGAGGAPDQIVSTYGSSDFRVFPERIVVQSGTVKRVMNASGMHAGDVVVLALDGAGSACLLAEISSTDPALLLTDKAFAIQTGNYQSFYKPLGSTSVAMFNQAGGTGATNYHTVYDLGPTPQVNRWEIGVAAPMNPVLQKTPLLPVDGNFVPTREVAEGIVNLQAQYGYDSNGDGRIDAGEWVDADSTTSAPSIGGATPVWRRVLAVRYAILARNRNYEAPPFSAPNPVWAGGRFTMTDIGGNADTNPSSPLNWRNYRYSVYESVVPMRNMLWGQ